MDKLQDLSASLAATRERVDALSMQMLQNEGVESKLSDVQVMLAAILEATTEQTAKIAQTASVGAYTSSVQDEILSQIVALREDISRQNVNIQQNTESIIFLHNQNAAILAAIQEHTKAIEKLAAPTREIGKRKRGEGTSADAGNERETSATDSHTSAAEKLVSSSLKGKGPADAGEGTSAAGGRKKMKKGTAPIKDVVSLNATSPTEGTCTWTIPNFSSLKVDGKGQKFSDTFSIGGHEWKLSVYPRGNGDEKDKSLSLYLYLADDTNKLPKDWKLPVTSTLSVTCQHDPEKSHKDEGDKPDIYSAEDNDWGWPNFISLTDFHNAANGFLVNDTVVIDAKIEVKMKKAPVPAPAKEVVSVNATGPHEGTYTWTIPNFSKLEVNEQGWKNSNIFSIGGHEWWLWVKPRRDWSGKDKSVSLYLQLADDTNKLPKGWKVPADFSLSVICQHDPEKSHKKEVNHEFRVKGDSRGWPDFISLTDFHNAANGFLVNDTVIIEAKIKVNAPAKEVVSVNATGPHEGTCMWTIPNFSSLKVDGYGGKYSDTFSIGGHEWRLEVYPRGWDSAKGKSVSLFLELADNTDEWPEDWKVTAAFSLSMICQHNPGKSHKKEVNHEFHAKAVGWGSLELISPTDLRDPLRGFLVNDTVTFEAKIEVKRAPAPSDSECTLSLSENDDTPNDNTAENEREPEEGARGNAESRRRGPEVTPELQSGATTAGGSGKIELGTGEGVGGSGGNIATSVGTGGDVVKTVFQPSLAFTRL